MSIRERVSRWARLRTLAVCLGLVLSCCFSAAEDRFLAHFYKVNDPTSWESLRDNADTVQLLSPDWFTLDQQLKLQSTIDSAVAEWARSRRLRLMPLLTNIKFDGQIVHALLNSQPQQQALIDNLIEICANSGFWGIQLDFENVPPADRDLFSGFARRFARALHARKLAFSIAVPAPVQLALANPANPAVLNWRPTDSAAGFDYHELAKVADLITVMTYDENVSQPGPIAGIAWVEACIRAMLRTTSRKKLLLGVALYYRQWSRPNQQTNTYAINEGPYREAFQLATQWSAQPGLDPVAQEMKFSYENAGSSHVVWFSDAGTLRQRLQLARQYRLRGFSAWRLGQEDPEAWQTVFSEPRRKR